MGSVSASESSRVSLELVSDILRREFPELLTFHTPEGEMVDVAKRTYPEGHVGPRPQEEDCLVRGSGRNISDESQREQQLLHGSDDSPQRQRSDDSEDQG